jgi:prepilin-type N-terminal cleavage/methylation domain-containing protein
VVSEAEGWPAGFEPGAARGSRGRSRARARQGGFSLIEILVTVAILGCALAMLVGSMASATSLSDMTSSQAQAEAYGRRLAEMVRNPSFQLICVDNVPLNQAYQTALQNAVNSSHAAPAGYTFGIDPGDVHWTTDYTLQNAGSDPTQWSTSCGGSGAPYGSSAVVLLWMRIKVWPAANPNIVATISVLKRGHS